MILLIYFRCPVSFKFNLVVDCLAPHGSMNFDSTPALFVRRITLAVPIAKYVNFAIGDRFPRISNNLFNVVHTKSLYGDIVRGLPLKDRSVDLLYASHVLEHLPLKEFWIALRECRRILKANGVFRSVAPNLKYFIDEYLLSASLFKGIDFSLNSGFGLSSFANPLSRLRGHLHHIMYDNDTFIFEFTTACLHNVRSAFLGDSSNSLFADVDLEDRLNYPVNAGVVSIGF